MIVQDILIHCTHSDDGADIAEIIQESFRFFLQKELFPLAVPPEA